MAYDKKPGGRPSKPYDPQQRGGRPYDGPRDGGRGPSFEDDRGGRDPRQRFDGPRYQPRDGRPGGPAQGGKPPYAPARPMDGPRRATPSRGPIPPARQVEQPLRPPMRPAPAPAPLPPVEELPENLLVGRNPIREALKAGRPIEKMLVAEGELTGSAREIVAMAREQRVVVQYVDRTRLDQVCKGHQGMLAYASAADYATVEDILALAAQRGEDPLVVVLDGVTDPHNLGAIIRSAECMGAHGVIVPERRAAGLGPAAVKASAGALSYIKVARVVNLGRTLDQLKQAGLWVTGAVMDAPSVDQVNLSGPVALVIGSEGEGLGHLVTQKCDQLVSLPMYGQIESLNASVAAGILLYEVAKARHA